MKRFYIAVIAILTALLILPVTAYTEAAEPVVSESAEMPNHTLLSRTWEFVSTYQEQIISIAGFTSVLLTALISNGNRKKNLKDIKANTSIVSASQNGVVGAVNTMIEGYNQLKESYEKYENVEDARNRLVGAVMVQNAVILDILQTVYVNNKNLPQGTKDLVNIKYAKCLSALENDDELRSCVEAVRKSLEAKQIVSDEETDGPLDAEHGDADSEV